jgi:MOSC domain-containing protein YiiM
MTGILHSINTSPGGVPKLARAEAVVHVGGLEGDRQRDLRFHGGPTRAVSLYSLELIEALRAEGHLVDVGSMGENLTLSGIPWEQITPGTTLDIGPARLELTAYAGPCKSLRPFFLDGKFVRVSQKVHPGWSRLYARVVVEGTIHVGDRATVVPKLDGAR